MQNKRPHLTTFLCLSTILFAQSATQAETAHKAPLVSTSQPDTSIVLPSAVLPSTQNKLAPVNVFSFRDPQTGDKVQFQYQPSSEATLLKYKPSKVRKIIEEGFPEKRGAKAATKKFIVDFPSEFLAFSGALLVSSQLHSGNDPVAMKHFVDQNVLDPAAYVSFAAFLAGSHSTNAALRATGLAYDPIRNAPNYLLRPNYFQRTESIAIGNSQAKIPTGPKILIGSETVKIPGAPTRAQRLFAPLTGPIGLAGGMVLSNVVHEIIADPDIRACTKARLSTTTAKEEADRTCDKAWENWVFSKKVADYTPDILAMGSAALFQAYVVNKGLLATGQFAGKKLTAAMGTIEAKGVATGAEKVVPFLLKGYRLAFLAGTQTPVGRIVISAANILIFMESVHPISPWFKKPFESVRQGSGLASEARALRSELDRAEKNNWKWQPQVVYWCEEDANLKDPKIREMLFNFGCPESKNPSPAILLNQYAKRNTQLREALLQDAYEAYSQWQDLVTKFAVAYGNAARFYQQIVEHISYQKNDPRAKLMPSGLFLEEPLYGISIDGSDFSDDSKAMALANARMWLETYLKSKTRFNSSERTYLPQILLGLHAADSKISLQTLIPGQTPLLHLESMNENQRTELERRVRLELLTKSLKTLRSVLATDPLYNEQMVQFGTASYQSLAQTNPFMKLRLLLGNPEPLGVGIGFIKDTDNDDSVIEQESKKNHPDGIGRAQTPTMSDYLLTSMVCGPEVDPRFSDSEKIEIFNKKIKESKFEQTLKELGLGSRPQDASDIGVLIAVDQYKTEITGLESRIIPKWSDNSIATEWSKFGLSFRPPRIVDGVSSGLCNNPPQTGKSRSDHVWFDIYKSQWRVGSETYNGIIDLIVKKIRPSLVSSTPPPAPWQSNFDQWWSLNVDTHVKKIVDDLRQRYYLIIKDLYLPGLLGKQEGYLASALKKLNSLLSVAGWDIKLGALDSIYNEFDVYSGVLIRISASKVPSKANSGDAESLKSSLHNLKDSMAEMGRLVTDISITLENGESAENKVEVVREKIDHNLKHLDELVAQLMDKNQRTDKEISAVKKQTLKNIQGLIGEMDSYWGIIRGIQVPGN